MKTEQFRMRSPAGVKLQISVLCRRLGWYTIKAVIDGVEVDSKSVRGKGAATKTAHRLFERAVDRRLSYLRR